MSINSKEDLKNKKSRVIQLAENLIDVEKNITELGFEISSQATKEILDKVQNDPFRILVIGQFNSGKSTLINALLGELVLSMNSLPCTGVINSIKYGKNKAAKVYFKSPLPAEWNSKGIQEEALKHIHDYNGQNIPPMELDINKLKDYIEIRDKRKNQKDSIKETPFEKVELHWPLELCKDGIEIIDSPGLNEDVSRTKITREYLSQADAVVFITNCIDPCQESEIEFVSEELSHEGHTEVFFVGNRIDGVKDEFDESLTEEKQQESKEYIMGKLAEFVKGPIKERIFFTNSIGALKGKINNDKDQIAASGILELEENLYKFLQSNRGKLKLMQIIPLLMANINKVREQIPVYVRSMQMSLGEFDEKLKEAQPFKKGAILKKNVISKKIQAAIEKGKKDIYDRLILQYEKVIHLIPEWVSKMELENEMTLNPKRQKEAREKIEREIAIKLDDLIQKEMRNWLKVELIQFIEGFINKLENEIGQDLEDFYDNLDKFQYGLSGIKTDKNIGAKERIAATILVGAVSLITAPLGMALGLKEAAKRAAALLAVQLALIMTPLGVVSSTLITLGVVIYQYATGKSAMENVIKKDMQKRFVEELKKNMDVISMDIATSVVNNLKETTSPIIDALNKEIEAQDTLIQNIKNSKSNQEGITKSKENMLNKYLLDCNELVVKLCNLKSEIE